MNKSVKKFLPILSILLMAVVLFAVFSTTTPLKAYADTDIIKLNELKTVNLSAGEVKTYYYTPTDNKYYVVETTGYYGTKLKVSNLRNGEVIDSVSGIGDNARIYFQAEASKQVKIDIKFYNSSYTGNTVLQIRQQTISMFGYIDDEGNSTLSDLKTPYSKFSSIYNAVKYENVSAAQALSTDSRGLPAINSEVVFFSGHGYNDGSGVIFYNNGIASGDIENNSSFKMDRTKVVMWSACCSASDDNSMNMSIAEASVRCGGAKSAVGFNKTVSFSSARTFTNKFFTKLAEGSSVYNAAKKGASAIIWAWDKAKKYSVFGRGEINVTDVTENVGIAFSLNKSELKNCQNLQEEITTNYCETSVGDNEYRYYEMINGYESSNYIDVIKENGNITGYEDFRTGYKTVLDINENYLNLSAVEKVSIDSLKYRLLQENDEHIIYYNFEGVMTPIKITFCTYIDDKGSCISEADCINLYNGERIDYSSINQN